MKSKSDENKAKINATLIVILVVAIIYSMGLFLFVETYNTVFWITFSFSIISFLFTAIISACTYKDTNSQNGFWRLLIMMVMAVYILAQIILSCILIIAVVSVKIVVFIETLMLAITFLISFAVLMGKNKITHM